MPSKIEIPGYASITEFAKTHGLNVSYVSKALKRGYSSWPRRDITGTNTKQPEYHIWENIIQRTTNPNGSGYKNYGARGIKVCGEWRRNFSKFLGDMGPRPSPKHSIDRIDSKGDYCKENCRWATSAQQARNLPHYKGNIRKEGTKFAVIYVREGVRTRVVFGTESEAKEFINTLIERENEL